MARPFFLVPFRRLLRLAGSRWRYSTPPPHGLGHTIDAVRNSLTNNYKSSGLDFRQVRDICLHSTASRPTLRSTQPPIQWMQAFFPRGLKRSGHEAEHSPPSSIEVKIGAVISPVPYVFMVWCFIKHCFFFHFALQPNLGLGLPP
jgi:hypothetical protein